MSIPHDETSRGAVLAKLQAIIKHRRGNFLNTHVIYKPIRVLPCRNQIRPTKKDRTVSLKNLPNVVNICKTSIQDQEYVTRFYPRTPTRLLGHATHPPPSFLSKLHKRVAANLRDFKRRQLLDKTRFFFFFGIAWTRTRTFHNGLFFSTKKIVTPLLVLRLNLFVFFFLFFSSFIPVPSWLLVRL
jgi:hypothetical protein